MNEKVWYKIFEDYMKNYYSIHILYKSGIIEEEEKHKLLEKLLDDIVTTFDSELNEQPTE